MLNKTGMDILSYLLELLQTRKEVGITDLGTFYKKKSPGRYDKETQSFLPPSYALLFTSVLKETESLAEYISLKRNISTDSAAYYIAQFVEEIQQKLETEHEFELENFGRLFFTEHAGLTFEPVQNINYGSEFYGLPNIADTVEPQQPVTETTEEETVFEEISEAPVAPAQPEIPAPPVTVAPIIETIEPDEVKDDLKNTLQEVTSGHAEITPAPEFIQEQHEAHPQRFGHTPESEILANELNEQIQENPDPETKTYIHLEEEPVVEETITEAPAFIKQQHTEHPNRFGHDPLTDEVPVQNAPSVWPKIITAIFLLLIIGAIIYYVKPEWFNQSSATSATPVKVADSVKTVADTAKAKSDSTAKTDSILKANQVVTKTDSVNKTKPAAAAVGKMVTTQPDNTPSRFHVIVISFQTEAKAQDYVASMKKKGYDAQIVNMEGTRKKISIGNYSTNEEAQKQKDIFQKKLNGKGFYVKEIKINTQP